MSMEITGNLPDYAVRKQNYSDYGKGYTSVTQNIVAAVSGTSSPTGGSFDIKA